MEATKPIQNKKILVRDILTALFLNVLLFLLIGLSGKTTFYINDDRTMRDALSGKFTESSSNYGIFISQIICLPLKWLYSLNYNIPFYGIFMILVLFLSCWIISYYLIKEKDIKKFLVYILFYCTIFLAFFFYNVMNVQFTIVAVFPVLAGICVIGLNDKIKIRHYILLFFLFLFSYAYRSETFLLIVPFILFILIYKLIKDKKCWKMLLIVCSIIVGAVLVNVIVNAITFANNESYKFYTEYNYYRSQLFDVYGIPYYSNAKDLYDRLGISNEALDLFRSHYMVDLDEFSLENIKQIVEFQRASESSMLGARLLKAFSSLKNTIFVVSVWEFVFLCVASCFLLFIHKNKLKNLLVIILLFAAMFAYGILIGTLMKFPSRVANPMMFATFFTILSVFYGQEKTEKLSLKICSFVLLITLPFISLFPVVASLIKSNTCDFYLKNKAILEQYVKENDENIYFVDDQIITSYNANIFYEEPKIKNMFYCTWQSRSPYNTAWINGLGYESLCDMYKTAQNLKIIWLSDNTESLESYLKNNCGRSLEFDEKISDLYYVYSVV